MRHGTVTGPAYTHPMPTDSEFEFLTLEPQPALAIRETVPNDRIPAAMHDWLPALARFAADYGLEVTGPPFTVYHDAGEHDTDMACGLPVAVPPDKATDQAAGRVIAVELPGGPAASGWHAGGYDDLATTHIALADWVAEHGRTPAGPPWEVYWTDPGAEPDQANWRTQVLIPLR